jgi:hypothetical protein
MDNINILPAEILCAIFKIINPKNRIILRFVCSYWKSILDEKAVWNDIMYIYVSGLVRYDLPVIKWFMKNTRLLDSSISVYNLLINGCNYDVYKWILRDSPFSEQLTSDYAPLIHLFTESTKGFSNIYSKSVFKIIRKKFPEAIKVCRDIILHKYDRPQKNGVRKPVREIIEDMFYNRDWTKLNSMIVVFELHKPGNEHMIPQVLDDCSKFSKILMKLLHIIPKNKNDKLWDDKIYQIRSANIAYDTLMYCDKEDGLWESVFIWTMDLFSSIMYNIEINKVCKSDNTTQCLVSVAISRKKSGCLKLMMDMMNLNEEMIFQHCLCGISTKGILYIIKNASELNLISVIKKVNDYKKEMVTKKK